MSRTLKISSENCSLLVSPGKSIRINNVSLEALVFENLPKLTECREYSARIQISIELPDEDKLSVKTSGYRKEEDNKCQSNQ